MTIVTAFILIAQLEGLAWPVEGNITSGYGPRWGKTHYGIDISAKEGTWVRSAAAGKVIFVGEYGGNGNLVAVRHANGTKTFYSHLQNYCVIRWQRVKQGQKLGRVGSTGRSTGPHLHFEIHVNKQAQDPLSLLPPRRLAEPIEARAVGGP